MMLEGELPTVILFIARGLEFVMFVRSPEMLSRSKRKWFSTSHSNKNCKLTFRQSIFHLHPKIPFGKSY